MWNEPQTVTHCHTLTMDMSHLPVRNVHLLVVAWWKRKHHYISTSIYPLHISLHHLAQKFTGKMVIIGLKHRVIQNRVLQSTLLTVMKPLESMWRPLCFKKPVEGTLPAADHRVQTSISGLEFYQSGIWVLYLSSIRAVTCSNDTHVCP